MKSPSIRVRAVRAVHGHRLRLEFSDGTKGVADLSEWVKRPPFDRLRASADFARAEVDAGAVEWPVGVGVATEALYALVHGLERPTTLGDALRNERIVSLRELRRLAGATQPELAAAMGIDQSSLSRFEAGRDPKLSTLRRYVEALGGTVEVVAIVGGRRVTLAGLEPEPGEVAPRAKVRPRQAKRGTARARNSTGS